jgi:RepB DNA-primase from phage plasmid
VSASACMSVPLASCDPAERVPARGALRGYLEALIGEEPRTSLLEVRPIATGGGAAPGRAWVRLDRLGEAEERILELAPRAHVYVGVAPRVRPGGTAADVERVWTLWADLDLPDARERLDAFRPAPAIMVESGSGGAHGYWPLRAPLRPAHAHRANRRLALALGADMRSTDPARILRAPATLNLKHDPPRPVICARLSALRFTAAEVVGGLPDSDHYRRPPARPQRSRRSEAGHSERALDGLVRVVAEAQPGSRNDSLFWACCRAFERADAGELQERHALDLLSTAALATGLSGAEVQAVIGSAQRTARRAAA